MVRKMSNRKAAEKTVVKTSPSTTAKTSLTTLPGPMAALNDTERVQSLPEPKLDALRQMITVMGEIVEHNVTTAVMSLVERDIEMVGEIRVFEDEVDQMEQSIDLLCCELLLEAHPKEENARFIFSTIKINMMLERISDLAVVISDQVVTLSRQELVLPAVLDFTENMENMEQMVRDAVRAMLEKDVVIAYSVIDRRDRSMELLKYTQDYLTDLLRTESDKAKRVLAIMRAAQAMQRIIEQTTNIAEEVIYMVEGVIIKHAKNNEYQS